MYRISIFAPEDGRVDEFDCPANKVGTAVDTLLGSMEPGAWFKVERLNT